MTAFLQANMPDKYAAWVDETITEGTTFADNVYDISTALGQSGDERPAVTLYIETDVAIDVRFNSLTEPVWRIKAGTFIWNRGEMSVWKLYIDNSQAGGGYAYAGADATVSILATG